MSLKVAIVFGSYNRLALLKQAVASVRSAVGALPYTIVVVDGGSTDGSRQWLVQHRDIHLIQQEGPLTGAVIAFNLGFGYAVDQGYPYACHVNDDAEFVTPGAIATAITIMEAEPKIGEVAFELDLRGDWGFEHVNGVPYANFGVIRTSAGMHVARAQGDPTGRAWWNPIYRTYGADTELGVWMWKLGYRVHEARGLRVHDSNALDELRAANGGMPGGPKNNDGELFWSRWRDEPLSHLLHAPAPSTPAPPPPATPAPPAEPLPPPEPPYQADNGEYRLSSHPLDRGSPGDCPKPPR